MIGTFSADVGRASGDLLDLDRAQESVVFMLGGFPDFQVNFDVANEQDYKGHGSSDDHFLPSVAKHDIWRILHEAGCLVIRSIFAVLKFKEFPRVERHRQNCDCDHVFPRAWPDPAKKFIFLGNLHPKKIQIF